VSDYKVEIQQTGTHWWQATIRQDNKTLAWCRGLTEREVKREVKRAIRKLEAIKQRKHYFYTVKGVKQVSDGMAYSDLNNDPFKVSAEGWKKLNETLERENQMEKIYWTTKWIMELGKVDLDTAKQLTEVIATEALIWNWGNANDAEVRRAIKSAKAFIANGLSWEVA
jgi:hypothetical protein